VSKKFLTPIALASISTNPTTQNSKAGSLYFNSNTLTVNYYDGFSWYSLLTSSSLPVAGVDYISYSQLGVAGGVATLDGSGYVPTSQINPSDLSSLPSQTGNSGKYLTTNGTAASWGIINADTSNLEMNIIMGVY
jgi:hypothetical protein